MQDKTVISGLTRRRRELTGEIEELLSRIDALSDDVRALDQVMLLFDPDAQPETIPALRYRPQPDWAARGEIQRALLHILRAAGEPVDSATITQRVMEARGIGADAYAVQRKRVGRSLEKLRARALIVSAHHSGKLWWSLAG